MSTPSSSRQGNFSPSHLAQSGTPNDSPTSTFSDSGRASSVRLDSSRSYRNIFASATNTPTRQIVVRSDPSLLTCFDPTDKELYDLWAPRR